MEKLKVGKIVGTHALKGEVKIHSDSDFEDERFKVGNILWIKTKDNYKEVVIKQVRKHKGNYLVLFEGLEDINLVEPYKQCFIYGNKDESFLEEDEYYYDDLIGCLVVDKDDNELGKVVDIMNNTRQDILRIEGKKKGLIPYVDAFILDVDIEEQVIVVNVIEGMLHEN